MKLDPGTIFIIGAVLFFYLRLIRVENRRKMLKNEVVAAEAAGNKKRAKKAREAVARSNWMFSPRKRDWVIAAAGFVMIAVGILIRNGTIASTSYQDYWWIPVSIGIVGFSFAFG